MMAETEVRLAVSRTGALYDAGLVTTVSLAMYLLLSQDAFYRFDAWSLMGMGVIGDPDVFVHYLSLPFFAVARSVGDACGLPAFESLSALSAISAAIAVGIHHGALRLLGHSRPAALASSALFATCVPVMFFASLIEHHTLFLAFAAAAFAVMAWLVVKPHWSKACCLGVLMAVSEGVHASGMLLPLVLLPWFLVQVSGRISRAVMFTVVVVAAASMAIAIPSLAAVVSMLGGAEAPATVPGEYNFGRGFHWSYLPFVLWRELIWPYLPMSGIVILGLAMKAYRWQAMVLLLSAGPYAMAILRIIPNLDEHGAYVLPIALIAAPLTVAICGFRAALALSLVSLVLGMLQIQDHEAERGTDANYAADALVVMERPAFVLVKDLGEMDSLIRYGLSEGVTSLHLPNIIYHAAAKQRASLPAIRYILGSGALYVSEGGEQWMVGDDAPEGATVFIDWLRKEYDWERVAQGRFRGARLRPR